VIFVQVILISHTPDPELAITVVARPSASPSTIEELWNRLVSQQTDRLRKKPLRLGRLFSYYGTPTAIANRTEFFAEYQQAVMAAYEMWDCSCA